MIASDKFVALIIVFEKVKCSAGDNLAEKIDMHGVPS